MKKPVRLCGGTFFLILLDAKKNTARQRRTDWYTKGVITEPDVFECLLQMIRPSYQAPYGETFKTTVSKYKACRIDAPDQWPLNDPALKSDFDRRVKGHYSVELDRMKDFADHFLDTDDPVRIKVMIRRLLSTLKNDDKIPDDKLLYAREDGAPVTKKELINADSICLESLLLGLWHFIVMNRPFNKIGKETYDYWTRVDVPNDRRKIYWDRIDTLGKDVQIYRIGASPVNNEGTSSMDTATSASSGRPAEKAASDNTTGSESTSTDRVDAEEITDNASKAQAEFADTSKTAENASQQKQDQTADNRKQTVNIWNNYGNGLQIENLGTLNWNPGKTEK